MAKGEQANVYRGRWRVSQGGDGRWYVLDLSTLATLPRSFATMREAKFAVEALT